MIIRAVEECADFRISALEGEMVTLERRQDFLVGKVSQLEQNLETSRTETTASQGELEEYRTKARKILEEKEKFIAQLREGRCEVDQNSLLEAEVDQVTRERNLYHEETLNLSSQLGTTRLQLASLEEQLEREGERHRQVVSDLTRQLQAEDERREEMESELSQQSEELRHIREELTRAKTSHITAIAGRETEINKLKDKINFRSKLSPPREEELR